jgi:hypothetical protein
VTLYYVKLTKRRWALDLTYKLDFFDAVIVILWAYFHYYMAYRMEPIAD